MAVEAKAWITGEYPDQEIHFELPSGPTGDIGPVGPVGPPVALEIGEVNVSASNLIEDERMAENILNGPLTQDAIKAQIPIEQIGAMGPKGDPGGIVDGTLIANGTDWNTLTVSGLYRTEAGTGMINAPTVGTVSSAWYGVLMLVRTNGSLRHTQIWYPSNSGHGGYVQAMRNYSGGVWSAWRVFVSSRVDQTAGRAIYQWDDTQSREQLIYGDTGWRDITSLAIPGAVTAGSIYIRRRNDRVNLFLADCVLATGTGLLEILASGGLPTGFKAYLNTRDFGFVGETSSAANTHTMAIYGPIAWIRSTVGAGTSRPTAGLKGMIGWDADQIWPTTLPGTAVGTIPNL